VPNVTIGTSNFDTPPSTQLTRNVDSLSPVVAGLHWSPMVGEGASDDSDDNELNNDTVDDPVEEGKREEV
jgi:hypothetical protein